MRKRLFLDMDGVLVNWLEGVHRLNHWPYTEGTWPYKMGPEGWYFYRELGVSGKNLFDGQGRAFWRSLEWLPEGKSVFKMCEGLFGNRMCLLTNPHDGEGVVDGRKDWIKREIPHMSKRVLIGACKEMCATPDTILIDDFEENIITWRNAGGIGVLMPSPWNSLHQQTKHYTPTEWVGENLIKILSTGEQL